MLEPVIAVQSIFLGLGGLLLIVVVAVIKRLTQRRNQVEELVRSQDKLKLELNEYKTKIEALQKTNKQQLDYSNTLALLGEKALKVRDLPKLMEDTVKLLQNLLQVDYAHILEFLPSENAFLLCAGVGWTKGLVGLAKIESSSSGEAGYAFNADKPVLIENLSTENRFSPSYLLQNHYISSGIITKMSTEKETFGLIGVYSQTERLFGQEEVDFLGKVGQLIGQAIENHHRLERLNLLERAINATDNGVVITDELKSHSPIIYVNAGFEKTTGYSAQEVIGKNCRFLQNEDRNQWQIQEIKKARQYGKNCDVVLRNYRKDGTLFWNQLHLSPVYNEAKVLTNYIGVQTDITATIELRKILEFTKFSLENANDAVFFILPEGKFFHVNHAACNSLGYSREELLTMSVWEVDAQYDQQQWELHWQQLRQKGHLSIETSHRRKDGQIFPVEVTANYLTFDGQDYNCAFVRDISQRKQIEQERDRFFTVSLDLLAIIGFDGYFKRLNPAFKITLGYSQEELLIKPFIEFVHPDDCEATLAALESMKTGRVTLTFENRYRCKDGSYRDLAWRAFSYTEEETFYVVAHDITARKQREEEIKQARNFLQTMIDHLPVAVCVKDGRADKFGQIILWNRTCERIFGLNAENALGKTLYNYFPQEQAEFFEQKDREAFAKGVPQDILEQPIDSHSLGRILLHTLKIPLYDRNHQPEYLLCISEDITARRQAEEALRKNQEILNNILESLIDVVWSVDFTTREYIYINGATEEIYGHPVADFIANSNLWLQMVHPDDLSLVETTTEMLYRERKDQDLEYRIIRPDGQVVWVRDRAKIIYNDQGNPIRIDGIITDVTGRKRAEQALKNSEEQFRLIFELSPTGIAIATPEDRFLGANQAFCNLLGYSQAELMNKSCAELTHPEDLAVELPLYQQLLRGEIPYYRIEKRYFTKEGKIIHCLLQAVLLRDQQGKPFNLIGQVVDITEKKKSEIDLRESEERLGRIITTISDGLLIVNDNGVIQFVNRAAELIFGRSQEELLNHDFGIPFVDGETTEIGIRHSSGSLIMAEIRVNKINWERHQDHLVSLRDITERYQAQKALKDSEEKYRQIVETAGEGIWVIDDKLQTTFVNQQMAQMLGYGIEEMLGKQIFDFMDTQGRKTAQEYLNQHTRGGKQKFDFRFRRKDGTELWAIVSTTPFIDEEGNYLGALGMISDITERKSMEQALFDSEQRLDGILNSIQDVVWSICANTFNVVYLNPAVQNVYGRSIAEFLENPNLWASLVHPEDRYLIPIHIENLKTRGYSDFQCRVIRSNGEVRWLHSRSRSVYDLQGKLIRFDGIDSDITESKHATEILEYNAFHDPLTDLPNRTFLLEHLAQIIHRCAVLFLDLDDFKVVNDSLGHLVGDQVLKATAKRLRNSLDSKHILARFGGDEFTILIEELKTIQEVIDVAEKIHHALTEPYNIDGQVVFINTSIGIAISDYNYQHPQEILRDADTAMYRAKRQGKGCYAIFNQQMHQQAIQRLQLEVELRKALDQKQFVLYYQPIVSLNTGHLTGFEALVRWQHPERGMISPVDFIPIAEETGLIVPLGKWVLEEACRQLKAWKEQYLTQSSLQISVNLSSKQFKDLSLVELIDQLLNQNQIKPNTLKLEITETMLMENIDIAMGILLELRKRGIELSLDDFGTGYSSLSYLYTFPVSTVKIDQSFVMRMQPDDNNTEIIRAIVNLCHTLGMEVIAEGVETELQFAQLRWLGCEKGQGYFFSRPLNADAATALIQSSPQWG